MYIFKEKKNQNTHQNDLSLGHEDFPFNAPVVREMVILAQSSNYQKCIKKTNKIPDYARDYKNEYLFIRGIDKACTKFVKN